MNYLFYIEGNSVFVAKLRLDAEVQELTNKSDVKNLCMWLRNT
jgi:hypothetical protein